MKLLPSSQTPVAFAGVHSEIAGCRLQAWGRMECRKKIPCQALKPQAVRPAEAWNLMLESKRPSSLASSPCRSSSALHYRGCHFRGKRSTGVVLELPPWHLPPGSSDPCRRASQNIAPTSPKSYVGKIFCTLTPQEVQTTKDSGSESCRCWVLGLTAARISCCLPCHPQTAKAENRNATEALDKRPPRTAPRAGVPVCTHPLPSLIILINTNSAILKPKILALRFCVT